MSVLAHNLEVVLEGSRRATYGAARAKKEPQDLVEVLQDGEDVVVLQRVVHARASTQIDVEGSKSWTA